jgi:hypothetical protein
MSLKGSLMTDIDVPHVRESYRSSQAAPTAKMAFAQWTERIARLPDLVASRELAGLSDDQLSALALEFENAPRYKRTDIFRFSFAVAALLALAGAGLAYGEFTTPDKAAGLSPLVVGAAAFAGAAFIALCAGTLTRLRLVPTEAAYGKVGLLVGVLNEQHPWLYNAYFVIRNPAAHAYREKVVRKRGPIRGMDYLLMRQVAELEEDMALTQNTRAVVAALQGEGEVMAPEITHAAPSVVQLALSAAMAPAPHLAAASGKVLTLGASPSPGAT